jgi:hypothetical protein
MSTLKSLSSVFEHRIIRIPDYQRGYAWKTHQLSDFWEDLVQLNKDRIHYTGVITLEPVKEKYYTRWNDDLWLIEGKGYQPYYVVDGQQRLTTALILIQAILESVPSDESLNYQSRDDIRQQYIMHVASDGMRRSFLFGYEKDNPSDEFLRTQVFEENSETNNDEKTFYTRNLSEAKEFFKEKLSDLEVEDIAGLYKKITQKFKFNLYEIDSEIDVFVTFETMNNRGKPLSSLELLKNRLIYLSTLFIDHEGNEVLRRRINGAWKTIYEYLGKNADDPLSDDDFLKNHWVMYFKFTRQKGDDYIDFLLDEKFTAKNVTHPYKSSERLTVEELNDYVTSLQKSIKPWFYMHYPYFPLSGFDDEENKNLVDRLCRVGYRAFKPLILAAFCCENEIKSINALLKSTERYNFTVFTMSRRRSHTGDSNFLNMARSLLNRDKELTEVVEDIDGWVDDYFSAEKFYEYISENYEVGRQGFFHWDGVRYFLYEYESWLKEKGKQATNKLFWNTLKITKKDFVTLEHIFPQEPKDEYWQKRFAHLSEQHRIYVTHSLGNLLPLSRAKNSSLQNDSFPKKVNNGNGVGYYNGSISENELAQCKDVGWSPTEIQNRGVELLSFMELRWSIELGDSDFKKRLLHLDELKLD